MNIESSSFVMIPREELDNLKLTQLEILQCLKEIKSLRQETGLVIKNITAVEFMAAIRIRRTKFDQLVSLNKIKTIKKKRKIYVPITEVDRYFNDSSIQ